ncbi:MAG: BON domain-containing protein [Bryobacteraceae bacterium]
MRVLTLLTAAGLVVLTGCTTSKPVETALTDTQVEEGIRSRLVADMDLRRAALSVDADVADHKVTLSGTVPTEALRTRAVDMAQTFQPGFIVNAKIDVKPVEVPRGEYTEDLARESRDRAKAAGNSIGDSLDDAWIHAKITTKLAANSEVPSRQINVDVDKNVVTLRGQVDTELAKGEAERIAKETEGVKGVKNLLKVNKA